jgi:hypothetical protein
MLFGILAIVVPALTAVFALLYDFLNHRWTIKWKELIFVIQSRQFSLPVLSGMPWPVSMALLLVVGAAIFSIVKTVGDTMDVNENKSALVRLSSELAVVKSTGERAATDLAAVQVDNADLRKQLAKAADRLGTK